MKKDRVISPKKREYLIRSEIVLRVRRFSEGGEKEIFDWVGG